MQVVVTGFRHSGTSLVTPLLRRAGLDLGAGTASDDCRRLDDPHVRRLHRTILERHGADRDDAAPFPHFIGRDHWNRMRQLVRRRDLASDVWGFTDPDAALFLGAWKHVMPDSRFVLVVREPRSCLRSWASCPAGHRGAGDPEHALRRWDTHSRAMLAFAQARAADCLVVTHDDLRAGRPVADEVRHRWGVPLDPTGSSTGPDLGASQTAGPLPDQDGGVDPDLDDVDGLGGSDGVSPALGERVEQTWQALADLASERVPL